MFTSYALSLMVLVHIGRLDHPAYRLREQSYGILLTMKVLSLPYVEGGATGTRLEVAARCRELEQRIRFGAQAEWLAQARPKDYRAIPWLDMLPDDYPGRLEILQTYLAQARLECVQDGPPHWTDYRRATTLYLLHLQRQGLPAYQAVELLDRMVLVERAWITKHRTSYTPNLEEPR